MTEITKTSYAGWGDCLRISNQIIECIIPTQIGPRIIKFGYKDQENEFGIQKDQKGMAGGSEWRLYGGHRLWYSPEHKYRTYLPDNDPIDYEEIKNGIKLIQPTQEESKIQKEITMATRTMEPCWFFSLAVIESPSRSSLSLTLLCPSIAQV